jgi:hypothetical protein
MSELKKLPETSLQAAQSAMNEAILKNSGKEYLVNDLIKNAMGSANKKLAPRLAFTAQPTAMDNYAGIFKLKKGLIPDSVIKQVRVQNHLIAGILRARGNHISSFGQIQKDRFDIGIACDIKPELKDLVEPEQMILIQDRINSFLKILVNCGHTEGLLEEDKMNLSEFLDVSTRNGLSFGRFATEIIWADENNEQFNRFRPVDAGTIMKAVRNGEAAAGLRTSSIKLLEQMTGVKIDINQLKKDRYSWIQYIDGTPRQAFTPEEMIVYNLYPSSDIEHNGYPVTPLDTVITSVTTHTSIEIYNKLYFQNGRAARGMLVIKSDEIDNSTIEDIKQQYNASINNVTNSFRTPIFGVGTKDAVDWVSTQPTKKDGEFQYLFDQTTRNILMAFGLSPDELPGFGHLSRATNQQSMSESSSEYKLTAARDIGLRPLILKMQDFLNNKIFPLIDPELSKLCTISMAGFDAETKEQESNRLTRDMPVFMTYDDVMSDVDKQPLGSHLGGSIPFNERYQTISANYLDQSVLSAEFLESPAANIDPLLKYKNSQFWAANLQTLAQFNPNAVKAYYATRSDSMDILLDYLQDYLDENE